jgi:DNA-binding response OmpR family regulator
VVDDEPEITSAVGRYLRLLGYVVDLAESGEGALALLAESRYDVAVVDLRLPGIDGVEVMRYARALHPEVAVILLTGHATLESAIAAVKAGAVDYLRKPVGLGDLAQAVGRALPRSDSGVTAGASAALDTLCVGPVRLDRTRCEVTIALPDGTYCHTARLTPTETAVLACLMERAGRPVSYLELAEQGLQYGVGQAEARSLVSPHICRLRKKLAARSRSPKLIQTVRGQGYLFRTP